ncbi:hypothetical protein SAMN00120144_3604 [Hymenobacter roseosalivarius DSM 11622]|uniref:Uncharacterized protein n=1 Tax=Hymenobacter roseosalivarius DSM 11622 TaxID=645990 RepID=A0A1W1W2F0_9BACT|nr:hypothetical protein SAMN00120144_3604 [Hymenobacter roseosalivarius DSM 11622]
MSFLIPRTLRVILSLCVLVACEPQQTTTSTPADSTQAMQRENDELKSQNDSLQKLLESERMTPRSELPPTALPPVTDSTATTTP